MYLRAVHAEHDIPTLQAFIRANPLGLLTTSHIPFVLDIPDETSTEELGTLRGHMARANPQTKAMLGELSANGNTRTLQRDVLVLFNGPAHHYVSPKFYTETKPATGKVVPTWDYAAVQVYGRATVHFEPGEATDAFLQPQLADLTRLGEEALMQHEKPWTVDEAPASYVALLRKAVIGVSIEVTDMGGKWKMSQELGEGDRAGTVAGFNAMGSELGKCMAQTISERADLQERQKREVA
ncbi:putative transcriptional regulator [Schizophyllum amplum]|uniref:Putative transcriptional regulator n=1 Tax=Schizophyllum amplum TaxID=97359 RepID=A0A550C8Z6_9AGAR|nr:putative transcriptional regulator [Auriculariopsis ampla]